MFTVQGFAVNSVCCWPNLVCDCPRTGKILVKSLLGRKDVLERILALSEVERHIVICLSPTSMKLKKASIETPVFTHYQDEK